MSFSFGSKDEFRLPCTRGIKEGFLSLICSTAESRIFDERSGVAEVPLINFDWMNEFVEYFVVHKEAKDLFLFAQRGNGINNQSKQQCNHSLSVTGVAEIIASYVRSEEKGS
ncbi:hypothetical protein CDAR_89671 [Caerostris darwini]|uniref:LAGLIDADG homing endonuclease n=1 Tax=Caerostris darwini TaxID=1538125 RepID=A0AAV4RS33_9ARAC|nr:hypothetical protein CDAR_89671 [Caerostris darwini]